MNKEITLVRSFFNMAIASRDQARAFEESGRGERDIGEKVLMAHVMAVAGVENFLNTYLFALAQGTPAESDMRDELTQHLPLEAKLRRWPQRLFDVDMMLDRGACRSFVEGKERRNGLMHFNPEEDKAGCPELDQLTGAMAIDMVEGAIAVIDQILFLQGLEQAQAVQVRKLWTGVGG